MGQVTSPLKQAIQRREEKERQAKAAAKTSAGKSPSNKAKTDDDSPPRLDTQEFMNLGKVWFDAAGNGYWRDVEGQGWVSYNEAQFRRYLKVRGFHGTVGKYETASQVDKIMVDVQHDRRLDFAGAIAGYPPGIHDIGGNRILIPRGPKVHERVRGPWNTLKKFFADLLRGDAKYLYAWLKSADSALRHGFPWRPGQMLGIAGPVGCGKSLLQLLVTEMFGGRSCKPYSYLTGESNFNGSYIGCEHWCIEDEASSTDIRVRRHFGAMLKNVIVNSVQNYRAMFREAIAVTPFVRLTMTLNDNPESLMVLPPLEDDILDKIILLRGHPTKTPGAGNDLDSRTRFWNQLIGEIPAFLYALERWQVPEEIQDTRYGVKAYQNGTLVTAVDSLSQESRLLNLIDTCGYWGNLDETRLVSAFELERELRTLDRQGEVSRLLSFSSACGVFLSRLSKRRPDRVEVPETKGHQNRYLIHPPKSDG